MSKPTVAVVVPLYNEAVLLSGCIEELKHLGADELIMVDGGSGDETRELLAESGLEWIESERGRALQMNSGAERAGSDILVFKHIDTKLYSGDIEFLRECFSTGDWVGGRFDLRLSGNTPALRVVEFLINLRSRVTRISTGDQCIFVRRDIFEQMGGFAAIPLMEDIEFSKRLKRQGRVVALSRKVESSSRRWERCGVLRTILLMWRLRLLYWLGVSPVKLAALYRDAR